MDAVLLVVILGLALLLFIVVPLLISRAIYATALRPPRVSGPVYAHDPTHADYYRPDSDTNQRRTAPKDEKPSRNDPRDLPLPRCPQCGTAVGFGGLQCVKCGY